MGKKTRNLVPRPGWLSTVIKPLWPRTMPRTEDKPQAAARELGGEERIENAGARRLIHAAARILHGSGQRIRQVAGSSRYIGPQFLLAHGFHAGPEFDGCRCRSPTASAALITRFMMTCCN